MAAFTLTGFKTKAFGSVPTYIDSASEDITAGEAITNNGDVVDPTTSTKYDIGGVAIADVDTGGQVAIARAGDTVEVSNTLTAHRTLVVKANGQHDYEDQLASGEEHIILGYTIDANTIYLQCIDTGNAKT